MLGYWVEIHKDEDIQKKQFVGVAGFDTDRVSGGDSPDGPISTETDGLKRLNQVKSLQKATIVIPGNVSVIHALMPLSSNEDLTVILSFEDRFEVTTLVNPQVGYVNRKATRIIATLSFHSRSWKLKVLPTDNDFALAIEASSATLNLGGSTHYDLLDSDL